ncbi:MAG: 7-carboxy-7-deazaguanine synthase QueE [Alphaproteobacteria bacterium]
METVRISEIFGPTIQGEGALIGKPTIFVRTGGCDYRCSWCDTLHAVDSEYRHEWKPMQTKDIMDEVETLSGGAPLTISLSGGNPAIQPLKPLIDIGHEKGYTFALETQGSIAKDWFADLDTLTLSPKPPSSGMETDWDALDQCISMADDKPSIALKFVIMDDEDYIYAHKCAARYPDLPVYLQPANHTPPTTRDDTIDMDGIMQRMQWLVEEVTKDKWYDATVLPQLHVLIWGNKQGV